MEGMGGREEKESKRQGADERRREWRRFGAGVLHRGGGLAGQPSQRPAPVGRPDVPVLRSTIIPKHSSRRPSLLSFTVTTPLPACSPHQPTSLYSHHAEYHLYLVYSTSKQVDCAMKSLERM